jgi:hypothetical protein
MDGVDKERGSAGDCMLLGGTVRVPGAHVLSWGILRRRTHVDFPGYFRLA